MSAQRVLVTGAAGGQQGQTGRHVSELLLARGVPVRAFVHRLDERSERLRALGAEVVDGDLLDVDSVRRAVQGVSAVYFAYPVQAGLLDATAIMAVTARQACVGRLINLVMLRSSLDAPTPRMRQNYLSEQVFEWAAIGAAHLRATVFYENLRALVRMSLATQGTIRLPWGSESTVVPLVSAVDVARVAAALLTAAEVPTGSTYPLIGALQSVRDIVATFGRLLGRDIRYEEISDEQWQADAIARGLNQHALEHLSQLWRSLRGAAVTPDTAGFQVTETIERLGGAPPKSFEDFVREERAALLGEPSPAMARDSIHRWALQGSVIGTAVASPVESMASRSRQPATASSSARAPTGAFC
jgi:uncharacterized protein YbjT (DUF2867 family)